MPIITIQRRPLTAWSRLSSGPPPGLASAGYSANVPPRAPTAGAKQAAAETRSGGGRLAGVDAREPHAPTTSGVSSTR
eukprot:183846-Prorocentrum_minimum.AAC.1